MGRPVIDWRVGGNLAGFLTGESASTAEFRVGWALLLTLGEELMNIDQRAAIEQELARLGLRLMDLPALAVGPGRLDGLLQHLRGLPTEATWHDVLPEWPRHWVPGRPETWTTRYRPFGPYDYQELPTGPAVHVSWPKGTDPECLSNLLAAARAAREPGLWRRVHRERQP